MDTSTRPAPADPAFTALQAKVYRAVADAAPVVGSAPTTVRAGLDDTGKRTGAMTFASIDAAVDWATWLHWPYAFKARAGRHIVEAYGQWHGFAWQITANEPLDIPAS